MKNEADGERKSRAKRRRAREQGYQCTPLRKKGLIKLHISTLSPFFPSIDSVRTYVRAVPYVVSVVCVQWEGRRGKGYEGGKKLSSSG